MHSKHLLFTEEKLNKSVLGLNNLQRNPPENLAHESKVSKAQNATTPKIQATLTKE
jgi:hypothetical protein